MGSNVPLKRRVIFYYVVKFYILYLTISYVISSTIVLYVNITVFILYFTLFFFTILDMYCKNTNTLILPRCSYFYYCCCYYRYFIIMSSGFRGVSRPTKDLRTANILYVREVSLLVNQVWMGLPMNINFSFSLFAKYLVWAFLIGWVMIKLI